MKRYPHATPILIVALLVGFWADLLFYGKSLGLSLLLFVLLFVGALIFVGRRVGVAVVRQNLWLLAPLLFFAGMVAVRANTFVTGLNVLAVVALLAYLTLYYTAGRVGETGLMTAAILPVYTAGKSFLTAAPIMAEAVDGRRVLQRSQSNVIPVVRGGLLAMPLLFIFTILLASADLIFAHQIAGLFSISHISHLFSLFFQGFFIFVIAWAAAGGLALALAKKDHAAALDHHFGRLRRFRFLGFTESTTLLILVNILFLAFVVIQFRYLFGGQANINLSGYTYADYARRGFFELLMVAILSLGLILGIEALTWRESKRQFKAFNFLSSLMIILVVIMMLSAFRRMRLYEAAFGYTELRLYVVVFMVWLGLFLMWFLFGLWRRPDRFALGALVVLLGFLTTLNLINPDAFIVRQNIARYWAGGDLDVAYLESLSADAVPALVGAVTAGDGVGGYITAPLCQPNSDDGIQQSCGTGLAGRLLPGLLERFQKMQDETERHPWQSFRFSPWRADRLLLRLFAQPYNEQIVRSAT